MRLQTSPEILRGFGFCSLLLVAPLLRGQEVNPAPQQPAWDSSSPAAALPDETDEPSDLAPNEIPDSGENPGPQDTADPLAADELPNQDEEPAPKPQPSVPASAAAPALPPSPQRPGPGGLEADSLARMNSPGLESAATGVPSDTGWHLPELSDPSAPFFQMEGLRMRLGEVQMRLSLGLSSEYNDNIFNANTPRIADYITTVTPTFSLGVGDFVDRMENYVALSYSPQPQFFAENSDQSTINENFELAAKYNLRRLTSELAVRYVKDSNPSASDIGRQEYRSYGFSWTNAYAIGTRTSLESELSATYLDYVDFVDYTTLSTQLLVGYELGPKVRLLLGPQVGVTYVEGGGEQPFQSILLGFEYDNFRKFVVSGVLGLQSTQYEGTNTAADSNFVTPTFNVSAMYRATETTSFAFGLDRAVQNSSTSSGQTYINTGAYLTWRQAIFRNWTFNLRLGYSILEYQGIPQLEHTDNYINVTPSLGYKFWQDRCTWSLYYTRTQRSSDNEIYVFDANVLGTRILFEF